ncbi:hypothetical protein NPIL_551901 [Nephila pilipes]|uniref:Uncharacterized protein n=1 Tax=Nephila pilipes TaxID=299642 RepID=A0A8X6NTC1_NEPPI|nr:hypothetical protein NPIL_551901 [Nephila pilipes]
MAIDLGSCHVPFFSDIDQQSSPSHAFPKSASFVATAAPFSGGTHINIFRRHPRDFSGNNIFGKTSEKKYGIINGECLLLLFPRHATILFKMSGVCFGTYKLGIVLDIVNVKMEVWQKKNYAVIMLPWQQCLPTMSFILR